MKKGISILLAIFLFIQLLPTLPVKAAVPTTFAITGPVPLLGSNVNNSNLDPSQNDSIDSVEVTDATLSYDVGEAPQATAVVSAGDADYCEIEYESWEQIDDETGNPVAFWYSDESEYNTGITKITAFEEGKTYKYSIMLKAKDNRNFASNATLKVNDINVSSPIIMDTPIGSLLIGEWIKTFVPTMTSSPTYYITKGANGVWTQNSNQTLTFSASDSESAFTGVKIDGTLIDADNYTKVTNLAEVTLKNEYLKLLSIGTHTFTYVYNDGECSTTFEVKAAPTPVKPSYEFVEGANGSWTQNDNGTLTFRANGDFSKFTGIKVDGALIDAKNYTAVSGSTIVTMKNEYLKSLSVGTHALTFVYKDGECSTNFEVKAASTPVKPSYEFVEGANGSWIQNDNGTLTFRANGDFSKFTGIKVDGALIDAKNYTAVSGSTIVTLKNEYLKSLSVGTHTLTFVYNDGECGTNFEVVTSQNQNDANKPLETKSVIDKKDNVPKTGDNRNMVLWITLLVASELGLVVTELYGRKQKEKHQ